MFGEVLSSIPGIALTAYESFVATFGSPVVLLAMAAALVAAAVIELCVRKYAKPEAA